MRTLALILCLAPAVAAWTAAPAEAGEPLPAWVDEPADTLAARAPAMPELLRTWRETRERRREAGLRLAQERADLVLESEARDEGGEAWWDVLGRQRRALSLRRLRERRERLEASRDAFLSLVRQERGLGLALRQACQQGGGAEACDALKEHQSEHHPPAQGH
jgi:hypothetical protein